MSLSKDALDVLQDPRRNIPAIEPRDAVTLIGSVQICIGQSVAVADAEGKQSIARRNPVDGN